MSIYTIGDLHLDFNNEKPMNIFGENWYNHDKKIKEDWKSKVTENDLVILPGDLSWASTLQDTFSVFEYLEDLPGKKILLKGNHDYWWCTLKKMQEFIINNHFSRIFFLYNNSYFYENYIIAGTRGWSPDNEKIVRREVIRLELSIQDGIKKYGNDKKILLVTHFPPTPEILEVSEKYNIELGIYGHLHGIDKEPKIISKIQLKLVSSDYLNFKLEKL